MQSNDKRIIYTSNAKLTKFATTSTPETAGDAEPKVTLKGYAIVWNQLSTDRGGYKGRLKPGSATFTDPSLAFYEHEPRALIGNTANVTLRILDADDHGIPVEIDLPDPPTGRDVAELVEDNRPNGGP